MNMLNTISLVPLGMHACTWLFGSNTDTFLNACSIACVVLWCIRCLMVSVRTYSLRDEYVVSIQVLEAIKSVKGSVLTFGGIKRVADSYNIPELTVSFQCAPYFVAYVETLLVGFEAAQYTKIHVYRWRWSPPLSNADRDAPSKLLVTMDNVIKVLECCSNDVRDVGNLSTFKEIALDDAMPAEARECAKTAATEIADAYKQGNGKACVFVLHGSPGVGKSSTAREVTRLLNGILYSAYDPTRCGECLWGIISNYAMDSAPMVIAFEEFDIALSAVVNQTVQETDDLRRDATDKRSWNGLLDRLKRKTNVVMIMTTNRMRSDLVSDVCNGDESYIRPGRVDRHIELQHASPQKINFPPIDVDCISSRKNSISSRKSSDLDSAACKTIKPRKAWR